MRFFLFLAAFTFLATFQAFGQEKKKLEVVSPQPARDEKLIEEQARAYLKTAGVIRTTRPDMAVAMALEDAQQLASSSPALSLSSRYIMVNQVTAATMPGLALAANVALLHNVEPIRPSPIGNGAVFRINLAEYVGYDEVKLRLLLDTWDRQTDTQFYLPTDETRVISAPRFWDKGTQKFWNKVSIKVVIPTATADIEGRMGQLIELTGSPVPIISIGQFMRFALNSDFGGLYPEFRQFDIHPEKGTAEQAFLKRADVDLANLGKRNADQRVVLFGTPTGQPRLIEYVPSAATRPSVGPTITAITRDYFHGEIDRTKHPFENLDDRKHDGTEIFLPTPEGGIEFALFNGSGAFVRSAPLNPPNSLAADRTVPPPWIPVLQGPSGCMRCHSSTNPDTKIFGIYQAAPNYINWFRAVNVNGARFDIFQEKGDQTERVKRLVSLYNGETANAWAYAGQTYAKYVFSATGVPLEQAIPAMMEIHDEWLYSFITPSDALKTLGYDEPDNTKAVAIFNVICPPALEPLRVTQVRAWTTETPVKITIDDWLSVYPEVALRVNQIEQAAMQRVLMDE